MLLKSKSSLFKPSDETKPTLNDERKSEVETISVMVFTTPVFGKQFRSAPRAPVRDGLLDFSVYSGFSKAELIPFFAEVIDKGYSSDEIVQHFQARKLKVKSTSKIALMADAVALGNGTATIKVHQNTLRVISTVKNLNLESP